MSNIINSSMAARVHSYIQWKRDLGYAIKVEARELLRFAHFADDIGHKGPLTISLILRWAQEAKKSSRLYRARRVEVARTFARYEASFEPNTQIPPRKILGPAHQRTRPYIYNQKEIIDLIAAAKKLTPLNGLRPQTYSTFIGLLASTGLRTSEALNLKRVDFDQDNRLLIIKKTKFHKSRIVPILPSVSDSLSKYIHFMDSYKVDIDSDNLLISEQGHSLLSSIAHQTFRKLCGQVTLDNPQSKRSPRLYDLRHTFACNVLLRWYNEGVDVNQKLPYLSTYLGHIKPSDTYWYLSAIPELMNTALKRYSHSDLRMGVIYD